MEDTQEHQSHVPPPSILIQKPIQMATTNQSELYLLKCCLSDQLDQLAALKQMVDTVQSHHPHTFMKSNDS